MNRLFAAALAAILLLSGCQSAPAQTSASVQDSAGGEASSVTGTVDTGVILPDTTEPVALASDPAQLEYQPANLLVGRVQVQMPAGSEFREVWPNGAMGVVAAEEDINNVEWTQGGETLVLRADELYAFSSGSLENDAQTMLQMMQTDAYDLQMSGEVALLVPNRQILSQDGGEMLCAALVRAPDNGLIFLRTAVFNVPAERLEFYTAMSRKIMLSTVPGDRLLETQARTVRIGNYTANIPSGYMVSQQDGVDFTVYQIAKLVGLTDDQPQMTIYIGFNPSAVGAETGIEPTPTESTIFGQKISWDRYAAEGGILLETLFAVESGEQIHIYMSSTEEPAIKEMQSIVTSLSLAA